MRYFLDTEFIEKQNSLTLISIGIVSEHGDEFYAVTKKYNYRDASPWVIENVITPIYKEEVAKRPDLDLRIYTFNKFVGVSMENLARDIILFIYSTKTDDIIEFWGYYADYDWILFCWIFGSMMDLPKGFPMLCLDLKQALDFSGKLCIASPVGEHNALVDARWNAKLYDHIFLK